MKTFIPRGRDEVALFAQEIAPSPILLSSPRGQRGVYQEHATLYSRQGVCK